MDLSDNDEDQQFEVGGDEDFEENNDFNQENVEEQENPQEEEISLDLPNLNTNIKTNIEQDRQSHKNQAEQIAKLVQAYFEKQNFDSYQCEVETEDGVTKITTTFAQEKYFDEVLVLTSMSIVPAESRFEVFSYFCRFDGEPYIIGEKYLRLLLARYFVRLNASLRYGCFSIDPVQGIIKLKLSSILSDQNLQALYTSIHTSEEVNKSSSENFFNMLSFVHRTSHFAVSYHIYRILHMVNLLSKRVMDYLDDILRDQYRSTNKESYTHLENMLDILQTKITTPLDTQSAEKYEQYLSYPRNQMVPQKEEDHKIISQIDILTTKYEQAIFIGNFRIDKQCIKENQKGIGGFSEIYQVGLKFQFENKTEVNRYTVVKKKNAESTQKSIEHEKKILRHLSQSSINKGECVFIQKFYECEQSAFKEYLFMDLCVNGSLDSFRNRYQETQSLNTKLFILYQIAMALYFLKQNEVYHVDLKPGNVLITRNFVVKLTDFGESFCANNLVMTNREVQEFRPGRTFPFAAPELDDQVYSEKLDIFSFGMLMSEYIFGELPVDYMKNNLQVLQQQYKDKTYQVKLNEQYIKTLGPKHLMKLIRRLILLCYTVLINFCQASNPNQRKDQELNGSSYHSEKHSRTLK